MSNPYNAPDPFTADDAGRQGEPGAMSPFAPAPYGQFGQLGFPQQSGGVSEQTFRAQSDYEDARKQVAIAYVLWLFLGTFGAHRFYLRETGTAIAMLIISCTIIGLLVTMIWALVDAFLIPGITERLNRQLKQEAYGRRGLPAY